MPPPRRRQPPQQEDFEPPVIAPVDVAGAVAQARLAAADQRARLNEMIQPRIDGHLLVYDEILNELVEAHRNVADTMDFGFRGRTRWAAVWELSGRCIALSRCVMTQLRAGFASETVATLRSIHEAVNLLTLVRGPGEEPLLRRWLDGGQIGAQKVRETVHRLQRPITAELRGAGVNVRGNQHELTAGVYERLSNVAHNTRLGFLESVSSELRSYAYGPHPDPVTRAVHVEYGGQLLEEVVLVVGSALATSFLGPAFIRDTIRPMVERLEAIREVMPINPPTVHGLRQQLAG
jgi:hypothetical protein